MGLFVQAFCLRIGTTTANLPLLLLSTSTVFSTESYLYASQPAFTSFTAYCCLPLSKFTKTSPARELQKDLQQYNDAIQSATKSLIVIYHTIFQLPKHFSSSYQLPKSSSVIKIHFFLHQSYYTVVHNVQQDMCALLLHLSSSSLSSCFILRVSEATQLCKPACVVYNYLH